MSVTLKADVMFVCGFPFLVTYSRSIKYTTAEFIPTQTAGRLAKCLMKVVYGYARGGFVVNLMLMDMEFDKIKDVLPMVEVNTTAAREHVPEIELRIWTIKERVRSVISDFPFNPVPMLVLVQTVYTICLWLNAIRSLSGMDRVLFPP